jgi:hypothetical protein
MGGTEFGENAEKSIMTKVRTRARIEQEPTWYSDQIRLELCSVGADHLPQVFTCLELNLDRWSGILGGLGKRYIQARHPKTRARIKRVPAYVVPDTLWSAGPDHLPQVFLHSAKCDVLVLLKMILIPLVYKQK